MHHNRIIGLADNCSATASILPGRSATRGHSSRSGRCVQESRRLFDTSLAETTGAPRTYLHEDAADPAPGPLSRRKVSTETDRFPLEKRDARLQGIRAKDRVSDAANLPSAENERGMLSKILSAALPTKSGSPLPRPLALMSA